MSQKRTKNQSVLPTHPHLHFREKNAKQYEVSFGTINDEDLEHDLRVMMNANLSSEKRDKGRVWLLEKIDVKNFLEAVDELEKHRDDEESEESDSESSTDDELIQKALARRMKSESSNTTIEEPAISDSEMEDVLSLSRRLRYILRRLDRIEKHLGI